jgi:fermentation-respiration switch protein FrsA (DUF1100 family)
MRLRRFLTLVAIAFVISAALIPIVIAEGSLHIASRPKANPAAADYLSRTTGAQWRDASIVTPDGVRLRGWYFTAAEPNGSAVLLLHGVGDTRLGMTDKAGLLLRAGYSVLLPDSRGHGASGGDLVTYGLKEGCDAAQWVRWMKAQPSAESAYLFGESMGASVAIESLACNADVLAVVAECPFARFREIAVYRVGQRLSSVLASPVASVAAWYSRWRYGFDVMQVSPAAVLQTTTVPVLLIHGTADTNIPPGQSRELHAVNPAHTELWEVPGARHVAAISEDPSGYRRRVLAWFGGH